MTVNVAVQEREGSSFALFMRPNKSRALRPLDRELDQNQSSRPGFATSTLAGTILFGLRLGGQAGLPAQAATDAGVTINWSFGSWSFEASSLKVMVAFIVNPRELLALGVSRAQGCAAELVFD